MNKEDMIAILEAWESFFKLDSAVKLITGDGGIDYEDFKPLWNLPDIIKRNSKYHKYESDEMYEEFNSIISDMNISAEEKYRLLAL